MIVAHADTQAPRALDSADARAAHERARAFFERPAKERSQESFLFDDTPLADPSVRSALWGACTGKCATARRRSRSRRCSSTASAGERRARARRLPQPRPLLVARLHVGEPLPGSAPSARASRARGSPSGKPEPPPGRPEWRCETSVHSCLEPRHDDPEQHLVYTEDGSVVSTTDEGRATIEILDSTVPSSSRPASRRSPR